MPSKSAKTRKDNRKRAHNELSARKTDASRKRRLYNKTLRDAIHTIDPDVRVTIIDQNTYIDGDRVEVVDGKIISSSLLKDATNQCDYEDAVVEYQEVMDKEDQVVMEVLTQLKETDRKPDCQLPTPFEKKSWKEVLRQWTRS